MVHKYGTALRRVVETLYQGDASTVTVKRARLAAEKELDLEEGFFKGDEDWKERSKTIVNETFQELESAGTQQDPTSSPVVQSKKTSKVPPKAKATKKRVSDEVSVEEKPRKRQKKSLSADSELKSDPASASESSASDLELSAADSAPSSTEKPSRKPNRKDQCVQAPSKRRDHAPKDSEKLASNNRSAAPAKPVKSEVEDEEIASSEERKTDDLLDEDDLSDVIDEPAPPKRKKKSPSTSDAPPKKSSSKSKNASATPATDLSPDEAEIKRLQSQLVKCGTRKVWGVEMKKFDTTSEKIAHLRSMLKEVGMEGRFSDEKAREIKEKREMAKDLEEIQRGNQQWGHSADEDEKGGDGTRPKRKLAKGLQQLAAFDDDEESD